MEIWIDMYKPLYLKMANQQGPSVEHRKLCSMLCGSLNGGDFRENGYMYMYKAESLHCSPETITTLLTGYTQYKIKSSKRYAKA